MSEPKLGEGITLILGGARSGKSSFAERLIEDSARRPVYVATGRAFDDEMKARIAAHQNQRGTRWQTLEEPLDLIQALNDLAQPGHAVLVDCLTLWVTNLMLDQRDIAAETEKLSAFLRTGPGGPIVFVSNEVGLGIVPENRMAREFRDAAGRLHQKVAALAAEVYFVAAGLPLRMKP